MIRWHKRVVTGMEETSNPGTVAWAQRAVHRNVGSAGMGNIRVVQRSLLNQDAIVIYPTILSSGWTGRGRV